MHRARLARLARLTVAAALAAAVLTPAAASADGRCKLYPHEDNVAGVPVTTYTVVC